MHKIFLIKMREKIIEAARSFIGTRFLHQGRTPATSETGGGMDCVGLIKMTADAAGVVSRLTGEPLPDFDAYAPRAQGDFLQALAKNHLHEIDRAEIACCVLIRFANNPQHAAIMTGEDTMVHASNGPGFVTEHRINDAWRRRFIGFYRFEGV